MDRSAPEAAAAAAAAASVYGKRRGAPRRGAFSWQHEPLEQRDGAVAVQLDPRPRGSGRAIRDRVVAVIGALRSRSARVLATQHELPVHAAVGELEECVRWAAIGLAELGDLDRNADQTALVRRGRGERDVLEERTRPLLEDRGEHVLVELPEREPVGNALAPARGALAERERERLRAELQRHLHVAD